MSAQNDVSTLEEKSYTFYFATNESAIASSQFHELLQQAQNWQKHQIVIQGHTDNVGDSLFNYKLGLDRAKAVEQILMNNGIPQNRIMVKSWGESRPIASNEYESGRQQNRRVGLLLTQNKNWNQNHQEVLSDKLLGLYNNPNNKVYFKSNKAYKFRGKQGTEIKIPANAFDVPEGSTIEVQVTEVFRPSDMILQSLTTTSNGKQLVTGGMIKVDAWVNGQPANLRQGKSLEVRVPSSNPNPRMQLFAMTQQGGGLINWVNPKALKKVNEKPYVALHTHLRSLDYEPYPKAPKMMSAPIPVNNTIDRTELNRLEEAYQVFRQEHATATKAYLKSKKYKTAKRAVLRPLQAERQRIGSLNSRYNNYYHDSIAYVKNVNDWEVWRAAKSHYDAARYVDKCFLEHEANILWTKDDNGEFVLNKRPEKISYFFKLFNQILLKRDWSSASRDSALAAFALKHQDPRPLNAIGDKEVHKKCMLKLFNSQTLAHAYDLAFSEDNKILDSLFVYNALIKKSPHALTMVKSYKARHKAYERLYGMDIETLAAMLKENYKDHNDQWNLWGSGHKRYIMVEQGLKLTRSGLNWEGSKGYQFNLGTLGRFINCDYFPRQERPLLAYCEAKLPLPPARVKTFMIFKKEKTVMPSYVNGTMAPNSCFFKNIPEDEQVQILSFYLDDKGQPHVALKQAKAAKKLPSLDYQAMSMDDFRKKLEDLNT